MSYLISDFLDFSQIKSGKFTKNNKRFDICQSIEKVIAIQKIQAAQKGIELKSEF